MAPPGPKPQASSPSSSASARPVAPPVAPASRTPEPKNPNPGTPEPRNAGTDVKAALLATLRESNKVFYNVVVATAQKVEIEGDQIVFTFAPVHKTLRSQLEGKRAWIEQLAQNASGRKMTVVAREGQPTASPAAAKGDDRAASKQADLRARAKAEPAVQNVLDVFGGEIEDVQEIE